MANVGGATYTLETQPRNMMNICNKYGFDILIISGSNGGHRQYKTYDGQRRGHKLPTGEAKKNLSPICPSAKLLSPLISSECGNICKTI